MNDYNTLITFIRAQIVLAPLGPGESHRDLLDYVNEKLNNPSNDRGDVKLMATRALTVAGLDSNRNSATASTLDQPANAQKRACAASRSGTPSISPGSRSFARC